MRLPFVSRERYEEIRSDLSVERERVATLTQQVLDLKQSGFVAPRQPSKPAAPAPAIPDLDDVARDGARKQFVREMTGDLIRTGVGEVAAKAEAERIASEMYRVYGEE